MTNRKESDKTPERKTLQGVPDGVMKPVSWEVATACGAVHEEALGIEDATTGDDEDIDNG